ncbi:MAG: diaminopimelate epimerase [Holosporales bacterium]
MAYTFYKAHGLGNDFVVIDARTNAFPITAERARKIADRRFGVGCDQLILLEASRSPSTDLFMRILNADGTEVEACGNATRCVAAILQQETNKTHFAIETVAGILRTETHGNNRVTADFGTPRLEPEAIPLTQKIDTQHAPIQYMGLKDPAIVSVGNPHLVFFVYDAEAIDLAQVGAHLTHHPLFPNGTNVEVVEILDSQRIRMRVYERGTGITPACGTGACASVVAAQNRGLVQSPCTVIMDGGELSVTFDQSVRMTGPVTIAFKGTLYDEFLAA